jgi:hypothetical protein
MKFFLLQRKTLVTISTRTTDRSYFLIFANTYEAALYEEDISSTDSNGSPNALKVTEKEDKIQKETE